MSIIPTVLFASGATISVGLATMSVRQGMKLMAIKNQFVTEAKLIQNGAEVSPGPVRAMVEHSDPGRLVRLQTPFGSVCYRPTLDQPALRPRELIWLSGTMTSNSSGKWWMDPTSVRTDESAGARFESATQVSELTTEMVFYAVASVVLGTCLAGIYEEQERQKRIRD